jgi:hypothetical protein
VLIHASILLATLIAVDAVVYLLLPNDIARRFDGYRVGLASNKPVVGGRVDYPKDYFVSHPTRGFDMRPGARGMHTVDGFSYPIWSNRFSCFDREWDTVPTDYYYFAGDSTAWGYTPFEQKFAIIFEERTGISSFKCGVTHTGQLHQFEKFREIVKRIGSLPKRVIIVYSTDDISNDYAHPHSTVVGGWQVDEAFLDTTDYSVVRVDRAWIEEKISERLAETRESLAEFRERARHTPLWTLMKTTLREYSISAQVAKETVRAASVTLAARPVEHSVLTHGISYRGRLVKNIYSLEAKHFEGGKYRYRETPFTAANRRALRDWPNAH